MSRDELVTAYVEGSISRRTFIRRLIESGVTLGAAMTYAMALGPAAAANVLHGEHQQDLYEHQAKVAEHQQDLYEHRKP